jgi:hypothetical protein
MEIERLHIYKSYVKKIVDFYLVVLELFNLIFLIFSSKIGVATRLG